MDGGLRSRLLRAPATCWRCLPPAADRVIPPESPSDWHCSPNSQPLEAEVFREKVPVQIARNSNRSSPKFQISPKIQIQWNAGDCRWEFYLFEAWDLEFGISRKTISWGSIEVTSSLISPRENTRRNLLRYLFAPTCRRRPSRSNQSNKGGTFHRRSVGT